MSEPIDLCEYCNINCENRETCREFYIFIIYEKIRKLENELYSLNSILDKYNS